MPPPVPVTGHASSTRCDVSAGASSLQALDAIAFCESHVPARTPGFIWASFNLSASRS
jgi:hypothetical protein